MSYKVKSPFFFFIFMKTHPYSYDLRWPFTTPAQSLLLGKKMSIDGKPAHSRTRILTDSARKRNRKEVLANSSTCIIKQELTWPLDEIEESIESSNLSWSVNISTIAHVVWKLGHALLMMLGDNSCTHKTKWKYMFFGQIS